MKFGLALFAQHRPEEPQAARVAERVLRAIRRRGERVFAEAPVVRL